MYMYVYVCVCVYIYIYIHIYAFEPFKRTCTHDSFLTRRQRGRPGHPGVVSADNVEIRNVSELLPGNMQIDETIHNQFE